MSGYRTSNIFHAGENFRSEERSDRISVYSLSGLASEPQHRIFHLTGLFRSQRVVLGFRAGLFRTSEIAVLCITLGMHATLAFAEDKPQGDSTVTGSSLAAHMSALELEATARTARSSGQYQQAEALYAAGYTRFPAQSVFGVGQALTVIDQRRLSRAEELVANLEQRWPGHRDVLHAKAYLKDVQRDFSASIGIYQKILDAYPDDNYAYRQWVLATNFLGLPRLALKSAKKRPAAFSTNDWRVMYSDRAAIAIRWAYMYEPDLRIARERQQQAVAYSKFYLGYLSRNFPDDTVLRHRGVFDYILALHASSLMQDLIHQYLHLIEEKLKPGDFPVEVLNAIADAYLYLEQPDESMSLITEALVKDSRNFNSLLTLFFAAIETEQFDVAETTIDTVISQQPASFVNHQLVEAVRLKQLLFSWSNRLAQADRGLSDLLERAPHNAALRSDLAGVYNARGWSRKSIDEYVIVKNIDSEYLERRIGQAESLLSLSRFADFEPRIRNLMEDYPENKRVQDLAEDWKIHKMHELSAVVSGGRSTGDTFGSKELQNEIFYVSKPWRDDHRVFAHYWTSQADLENGRAAIRRYGMGGEFRRPDWDIAFELSQSESGGDTAVAMRAHWRHDDRNSVIFSAEGFGQDTPVRAWDNKIKAEAYTVNITHRASERYRFDGTYRYMPFTDGNNRNEFGMSAYQLLYSEAHHQLALIENGSYSDNSKTDTPYFNPISDYSTALGLEYQGVIDRRYDKKFSHRLYGEIGRYYQRGFGNSETSVIEYDQRFHSSKTLNIFYGIRFQRHSYDGKEEDWTGFRAGIEWRFD